MSACAAIEDACGVDGGRADPAAAPAHLLRRVDREPRAARLHAPRARLPRLRQRGRRWRRPPRGRGARAADQEGGQRADPRHRRPRGPPDQRARRRLLPRAAPRELRALRRAARGRRASSRSRRCAGGRRWTSPTSSGTTSSWRCPTPDDYPLERGRLRVERRARHRARRVRGALRGGARARTRPRCTRGCASAGPTSRARSRATRSTPSSSRRSPREAAADAGLGPVCRNPFRSIVVRSVEILYALDEALRIIDAYEEPDAPAVEVQPRARAPATAGPRRRAGCSGTATGSTRTARSWRRRSCRPPRRTSATIEEDLRGFVARNLDLTTRRCAPLRAGDPQLRPVHLLRDPLPDARGGSRMSRPRWSSASGTTWRSDDAAGPRGRPAPARRGSTARVRVEHEGEPVDLIEEWAGADAVIVVDAVSSGAPPGTIHRLDAARRADPGGAVAGLHARLRPRRGDRARPRPWTGCPRG